MDPNEHPTSEKVMPFLDHLEELRTRILRCLAYLFPAAIAGFLLAPHVIGAVTRPFQELNLELPHSELRVEVAEDGTLRAKDLRAVVEKGPVLDRIAFFRPGDKDPMLSLGNSPTGIIYRTPMAPLMITVYTGLVVGLVLVFPLLLWECWGFVSPGLLPQERRFGGPFIASGVILFVIGAAFAYFTIKLALEFSVQWVQPGALYYNDMSEYLQFLLFTMVAFGLTFELPLITLVLTRLGLVRRETLAAKRRIVFTVLLIIAALVTPTQDPVTLLLMAMPLYLLFELALLVSKLMESPASQPDESQPANEETVT